MNLTALTLLSLAAGQPIPPAPADPIPFQTSPSRTHRIPITYEEDKRPQIMRLDLVASRDGGQTWGVVDAVTRDKDHFVFTAKEDGVYLLNIVITYKNGKSDPADPAVVPPALKLLVDSTPPEVRLKPPQRVGDEVVVEWEVADMFPSDGKTQVLYKPAGPGAVGDWQAVPAGSVAKRSARFKPFTPGAVAVKVAVADMAGNPGEMQAEVPAIVAAGGHTQANVGTAVPPGPIVVPDPPAPQPAANPLGGGMTVPPNPIMVPSDLGQPPLRPADPPVPGFPSQPPPQPAQQPAPQPVPQPITPAPTPPAPPQWTPPPPPAVQPTAGTDPGDPKPLISGSGTNAPPPAPATPAANTQYVSFLRFDLQYQVEGGPSGVGRVDLYVTRDGGRSWVLWSQHPGKDPTLRVALDARGNTQPEGEYGFRLVPVSGAGLSDGPPAAGSAPEMRVTVDVTPPFIQVWEPRPDPTLRNVLNLIWKATDANFGRDPILIEWSEGPTGPWKSVAADGIAAAGGQPPVVRVPNTGTYAWQVPASLGVPRVYLRFTAWDLAGNRSEVITPDPILVDMTKPRAKIQGFTPAGPPPRP